MTAKADFLVHVKPLAVLFRAKLRSALRQTALWAEIPAAAWQQPWVVDCRPVGTAQAALKYLAPYIFRVALSNNRIVRVADDHVTFRYTVSESGQTAYCSLPAQEFLHRFLQHILPKGFVKVRYYGLFRVGNRRSLKRLRGQLRLLLHLAEQAMSAPAPTNTGTMSVMICPNCGQPMRLEGMLLPHNRGPPGEATSGTEHRQRQGSAAWLPWHRPAYVCPKTALRTIHRGTTSHAHGRSLRKRVMQLSGSPQLVSLYRQVRHETVARQTCEPPLPTPTPDQIPYIMRSCALSAPVQRGLIRRRRAASILIRWAALRNLRSVHRMLLVIWL